MCTLSLIWCEAIDWCTQFVGGWSVEVVSDPHCKLLLFFIGPLFALVQLVRC
jgi:hypothetical protein